MCPRHPVGLDKTFGDVYIFTHTLSLSLTHICIYICILVHRSVLGSDKAGADVYIFTLSFSYTHTYTHIHTFITQMYVYIYVYWYTTVY